MDETSRSGAPLVHLELHTDNQAAASAFYACLLGWRPELIETRCGTYLALDLGRSQSGGIVECGTPRPQWLPYVEVDQIAKATVRAEELGAHVLLTPREGPSGWRSVISTPHGGELALWEPKQ